MIHMSQPRRANLALPRSPTKSDEFLLLDNEMSRLIQRFDWSQTRLGPLGGWPQSLRTAVGIMLQSPVPIVMLWGLDGIMLYNDAYSIFAGARHPSLLGSKVIEGWPEVADFNRNVMAHGLAGKTLSYNNQQLTLFRNNRPEEVWMNLNYSPVIDESGKPAGIFAIVIETTQQVLAEARQKAAEDELKAEHERMHSLLMQAPAVIAVLRGPEHVYDLANPQYMEMIGNRAIIGKPIREALPELAGQGIYEILDEVYHTGKPYVGNEVFLTIDRNDKADAGDMYLNFIYQPSRDGAGKVDGILVHAVDVTEQVLARQRLIETAKEQQHLVSLTNQRNELIKLNTAKDEFISLASHQLRTPATAVKQYISLLLSGYAGPVNDDQTKFLQTAYDSNERQLNIISDLLKTAQLDSSRYLLQKDLQPLRILLREVIDDLRPTVELKQQTIVFHNNLVTTTRVMIDSNEMKLVFANLIENASKYSHPGTMILICLDKKDGSLEVRVVDQGVGLEGKDAKRIFDKFTRVNNELSDTVTGTGLGLYWVKKIIKLHQGTIKVESILGKGSTFTVRIPLP